MKIRYTTIFCIFFCLALGKSAAAQDSSSAGASDVRVGVYYGMDFAQPQGGNSGVTVKGKQGNDIGLMGWLPLVSDYLDLRASASHKTAVKSYTDSNLSPTSTFSVTETTYDAALGLQLSLIWDFYLYAEGKLSVPASGSSTIVTPGGSVVLHPTNDFLEAAGLGYELFDFSDIYFSLEAEYDHGTESRPLGETNSFLTGQLFVSYGF